LWELAATRGAGSAPNPKKELRVVLRVGQGGLSVLDSVAKNTGVGTGGPKTIKHICLNRRSGQIREKGKNFAGNEQRS